MPRRCRFSGLTSLAATSAAVIILLAAAADAHARSNRGGSHGPHKHTKVEKFKAKTTGTVKAPPNPRHNPPRCPPEKSNC